MVEIRIPDPTKQYEKTPAWVRRWRQVISSTGQVEKLAEKQDFITGAGDTRNIWRWHELVARIKDFVETKTLTELKAVYKELRDDDYVGTQTKLAVAKAILKFYFSDADATTPAEMLSILTDRIRRLGRWGLGCPHGCGRHWEFKPTADLTSFEPTDLAAVTGPQPKTLEQFTDLAGIHYLNEYPDGRVVWEMSPPEPYYGYLNWHPQTDGKVLFACDKCGQEVKLVK